MKNVTIERFNTPESMTQKNRLYKNSGMTVPIPTISNDYNAQ